jgi:hypothetical protein
MKLAICFSGQIRTGLYAFPNIKRFIDELWDDCDFFLHTWDLTHEKPTPAQVREGNGFALVGNKQEIDFEKFKETYNFKKIDVTPFYDLNGQPTCIGDQWQWWSWLHSVKLKQQYEIENNIKYNYVIKIRPDIIYHESLKLLTFIEKTKFNSFSVMESWMDNDSDMSLDDVLYVSDSKTMDLAITVVNSILKKPNIKPVNYALYKHLIDNNIVINNLNEGYFAGKYTVLRQQCISFCTLTEFDKCERMDKLIYYPTVGPQP